MKKLTNSFHKHIILFCTLVVLFWLWVWLLSAYSSHNEASAAEEIDVSISAFTTPDIVSNGDAAAFLIYYQTQGNGTAAWIQVSATLDEGLSIVSAVPGDYSVNGSTITWSNLPNNYGPILLEVIVNGSEWSDLSLQATVTTSSNDINPSNNNISTSVSIINTQANNLYSDLELTTQSYSETIGAGEEINYVLRYKNNGTDDAWEVVIVTSIPSDLVYATSSVVLDPTSTANTLVWRLTDVSNWSAWTISFRAVTSNLLDIGDTLFVYSAISSANNDPEVTNDQTNATITIDAEAVITEETTPSSPSAPAWWGWWAGWDNSSQTTQESTTTNASVNEEQPGQEETLTLSWFVPTSSITNTMILPKTDTCAPAEELFSAYTFAFNKSITTMKTIAEARMCDGVSRIELAKMMTNYAINILEKTPNTSITCSFNDIANQSAEMQWYAEKICQLSIMGLEQDGSAAANFNPTQKVDRATFATAFSRLLYGNKNNAATGSWYAAHIQALKEAGILKNTDPTIQELRWYIMLMMMRSSQQ